MGRLSRTNGLALWLLRAVGRIAAVSVLAALLGAVYWLGIRPHQLHWGATPAEQRMVLPEDNIVVDPAFDATRAITISAPPDRIWPWLAQMGYKRAGFYGYDLIENPGSARGLRSAATILPEFQHPRTGDVLPLSVAASLQFGTIDPNRTLVWRSPDEPHSGVFIWALIPVDATHTRLISRIRWRYLNDPMSRSLGVFTEFSDHVAVRAILRGVRDRVEGRRRPSLTVQAFEIAGWLLVMAELASGMALALFGRRSVRAWWTALGAGMVLFLVLYGPAPHWLNAAIPWVYLTAWWLPGRSKLHQLQLRAGSRSSMGLFGAEYAAHQPESFSKCREPEPPVPGPAVAGSPGPAGNTTSEESNSTLLVKDSGQIQGPTNKPAIGMAEPRRATDRKGQAGSQLVDEVANIREDTVAQFHSQQARTE